MSQVDRERLTEDLAVGGQALIEGVMMRVPGKIVMAVRQPNHEIVVREEEHLGWTKRWSWLDIPVLRGSLSFFEMMIIGLKALNYSADVAMRDPEEEGDTVAESAEGGRWKSQLALALTTVLSLGLGIGLFFFLPLYVAQLTGAERDALRFNLVAGLARLCLFLLYLWLISHWKDVRRVFEYHGAEHKSIYTVEAGAGLTVDSARGFARLHPRCGTSFLLIVVGLSILVFALADSAFPLIFGHAQSLLQRFATHLCFLPAIAGISFELLKISGKKRHHPLTRILIAPGLWLQRITTREPADDQLEVALVALRRVMGEPPPASESGS